MKRLLLFFSLLLPLAASAARPAKSVTRSELSSIISDFRRYEGVEVVRLGRIATGAVKGVIRLAGKHDPDMREALAAVKGLKSLTVLEYEDCAPAVRERIENRIARALLGGELLMEAKDGHERVQVFGVVDDASGTVRDFVVHAPGNSALICLFGSLSMDMLSQMMAE